MFVFNNVKKIKEYIYLIIPKLCMSFWALFFLIRSKFKPLYRDLPVLIYKSGKQILINPSQLYDVSCYFFLPNIAIFGMFFTFLPYNFFYYVLYTLNFLLGILYIGEYDKILKLLNVKKKFHRFLFLIIISNGWLVLWNFVFNQSKIIICFIFLFVLRREIHFKIENRERNFKFYLINYSFFIFAIGFAPYLVFFLIIYIFQDFHLEKIFNKVSFQKYGYFITAFIIQNFFFIIFPYAIFDFLEGFTFAYSKGGVPEKGIVPIRIFYLREFVYIDGKYGLLITLISIFIISSISIILILCKNLKIEQKFSILALVYIIFDVYKGYVICLILMPLILLSFIPYLNQEKEGIEFIKENKDFLIGLISVSGFYFTFISMEQFFIILPLLQRYPLIIIVYLRWIILLSIMLISLCMGILKHKSLSLIS